MSLLSHNMDQGVDKVDRVDPKKDEEQRLHLEAVAAEVEKEEEVDDHSLGDKDNPSNRSLGANDLLNHDHHLHQNHVMVGLLVHVLGRHNLLLVELHDLFSNSFLFQFCVQTQHFPQLEDQICRADQK